MTTLAKAPLLEVATEIRWGIRSPSSEDQSPGREVTFDFQTEEIEHHSRRFLEAASAYSFAEVPRGGSLRHDDNPFMPAHAYIREASPGLIYQLGTGVMVINQTNEGYDWPSYKHDVLAGFALLRESLASFYDETPFFGCELTYADGFFLQENETPEEFLRNKLAVRVKVPEAFFNTPFLKDEPWSAGFLVNCALVEPEGFLTIKVDSGEILGREGFLMTTQVLSLGTNADYSSAGFGRWLEAAHEVHRHAFRTLIQPAYLRSFA